MLASVMTSRGLYRSDLGSSCRLTCYPCQATVNFVD